MRIARELEGFHPVGLQIMAAPDVVHCRLAHPQLPGQQAAAPLRAPLGFGSQGGVDDLLNLLPAIAGLRPRPEAISHRLCNPCWRKRLRHNLTVWRLTSSWDAIALSD